VVLLFFSGTHTGAWFSKVRAVLFVAFSGIPLEYNISEGIGIFMSKWVFGSAKKGLTRHYYYYYY
jgi:hypothetical protein